MELNIVNRTRLKIEHNNLIRLFQIVLKAISKEVSKENQKKLQREEISLVFLGTTSMKNLNGQYRGKSYATDVLSFDSGDPLSLGELFFCPDVLKKQAVRFNQSMDEEFTYMLIHGVLHLLGYEHENDKKSEVIMFKLQDKVFSRLTAQKNQSKIFYVHRKPSQKSNRNRARRS